MTTLEDTKVDELVVNTWTSKRRIHRTTCRTIAGKQIGSMSLAYISTESAQRIVNEWGHTNWACKVCKPVAA